MKKKTPKCNNCEVKDLLLETSANLGIALVLDIRHLNRIIKRDRILTAVLCVWFVGMLIFLK